MEIDRAIVNAIVAMIALVAALIAVVGPFARKAAEAWLKARLESIALRLPQSVRSMIETAARDAARAVEQMRIAGYIEDEGKALLKRAEELAEKQLLALGYEVELDVIRMAIENVIWRQEHKKPAPAPVPDVPAG